MMFTRAKRKLDLIKQPLLASHNAGKPCSISAALMRCTACKTQVIANFSLAAACPVCAETMAPAKSVLKIKNGRVQTTASGEPLVNTVDFSKEEMRDMPVAAHCEECATDYRSTAETIAALEGHKLSCMVCASTLVVHAESVEDMDTSDSDEDNESLDPEDAEQDTEEQDEPADKTDEDDDSSDESADPGSDDFNETDEDYADKIRTQSKTESESTAENTNTEEELPKKDETAEELELDRSEAEDEHQPVRAMLNVNVFDSARKNTKAEFAMVLSNGKNPTWYLFADGTPVAYANKDMVKAELHKSFLTPTFNKIFNAELSSSKTGLNDEIVANFGLTPIVIEQPVDKVVQENIQAEVQAKTLVLSQKTADVKARFDQSIGIAAVGINKGIFSEIKNPLREGLIASLNQVNVRDAESLVDHMLTQYIPEYTRTIVAKALEIEAKPEAAIAELASIVTSAPYRVGVRSNPSTVLINDLASGGPIPTMAYDASANHKPAAADGNPQKVVNLRSMFPLNAARKH